METKDSVTYPPELDTLVRKLMLFKVELTDGNLAHNWRNYSVKCATDDKDLIKKFMTLHKIKDWSKESDADLGKHCCESSE